MDATDIGEFSIPLDGRWEMRDLEEFSKLFTQLYSFYYALEKEIDSEGNGLFSYAFEAFPWLGGYSAVNFYNKIYRTIPRRRRPNIKRMEYASPGELVLIAIVPTCLSIVFLLRQIVKLGSETVDLYRKVQKEITVRKLTKVKAKGGEITLSQEDHDFCLWAFNELASKLGITDQQKAIIMKAAKNPLAATKILASLYRRGRDLAEFEGQTKTRLLEK